MTSVEPRKLLGAFCFILLFVGAVEPLYVRIFFMDRTILADGIGSLRYGKMPEIRPFLEEVARRSEPGMSVAIVIPGAEWDQGYEYAFYRAGYVLAGRTVLPVITPDNRSIPANLSGADLVAAWRTTLDSRRFEVLWEGAGGVLARPRR